MASCTDTALHMEKGYCEDDFQFSKLFKCVNVVGQNVLCDVVRAMYSHMLNSNGGSKTLRQYLVSQKWSNRKFKDCFTKDHYDLLDLDLNNVDFDISFACTVMTVVCKDLFDNLSDDSKSAVEELKRMRNRICHQYGITCSECITLIDFLRGILNDIYLGVGTVVGKDFSDNIRCMENTMQSILSAKISQVDDKTYSDGVRKFRNNSRFKMINEGKREVQSSYSKLQTLNPHIWITEEGIEKTPLSKHQVERIFTTLNIEYSKNNIKIAEIFNVTERVEGPEQIPSAIVMYGLSGCGKTFLCHYLIHEWCKNCDQNVTGLDKFDLIIFVEVRKVRSKTLIEFLKKECLVKTCEDFDDGDIIPTLKDLNVLIVVDGFEEAKIGNSLNLVGDIFCKFYDKCILLTTLPEYKDDVLFIARKYKVSALPVQIHGFDERNLKIFSEKVFGTLEKDDVCCAEELNSFLNYIETTGKGLGKHLKLPLTLSLLIYLWSLDSRIASKIASPTMLYWEIFKLCQKRFYEQLEKKDIELLENKDGGKLEYELDKIFFYLGQQAWSLLLKGELMCLTEKEFKSMMECCWRSVDVLDFLSTYLYCESEENSPVQNRSFVFLHKTQMEYLAGAYLANSVTLGSCGSLSFKDIDVEVENETEWQNLLEVVKYMTGSLAITEMLKVNEMSEIFEILRKANISSTDFNFWWNFYLETLKNEDVGCKIVDKLPQSVWTLDDEHVVSGLSFYRDLDVNLETLKIEIPANVDPYDIKELLTTLKEIRCKKMECMQADGKIDPVMIEFHFWNHENNSCSKLSDGLLLSLNPWGHLTSFTGGLGEQEILSSFDKLEAIRVRLNSVDAFSTFKISLSRIYKTVRTLCITLAIPFSCSPSELCDLDYTGKFELSLMEANDEHKEWIVGVVKLISGRNGCHKLSLLNSEMTCETIGYLLKELESTVHEKISFNTINKLTSDELEELRKLQGKDFIEIS